MDYIARLTKCLISSKFLEKEKKKKEKHLENRSIAIYTIRVNYSTFLTENTYKRRFPKSGNSKKFETLWYVGEGFMKV